MNEIIRRLGERFTSDMSAWLSCEVLKRPLTDAEIFVIAQKFFKHVAGFQHFEN